MKLKTKLGLFSLVTVASAATVTLIACSPSTNVTNPPVEPILTPPMGGGFRFRFF
ncbi:hypothetical protein [Mycoplasmopsis agassizii]|uniref:hypothetical protein n=1 Tax=Mycoplasmopsis agassizii TaxID=33922 RepID=UPI0013563B9A|nr:hypothetical protein [Mycoplasmopsis agassizii]